MTLRSRLLTALGLVVLFACQAEDISRPAPGTVFASIRDTLFSPDTVAVPVGRSVRWTNEGALVHTVVANSSAWQSPFLGHESWFEVRFDAAGTFDYHCSQHPTMIGTVVVE